MTTHPTANAALAVLLLAPLFLAAGPALAASPAPTTIELTAVVRDFKQHNVAGGHADFERWDSPRTARAVATTVGTDGKPVFSGLAKKLKTDWKDAAGRPICWHVAQAYPRPGDQAGTLDNSASVPHSSAANFNAWYNDILGVNLSVAVPLTVQRQPDGSYVFDNTTDPTYAPLGGFYPIDNRLFGNMPGKSHNYSFTTEVHATFVYDAAAAQVFQFSGDDDVWVFINDVLVIDLGGLHGPRTQFVDISRLGLVGGRTYNLDMFHAERHTDGSNFRFQTNLVLADVDDTPQITGTGD